MPSTETMAADASAGSATGKASPAAAAIRPWRMRILVSIRAQFNADSDAIR